MNIEKIINDKQIGDSSKKVYLSLLKRLTKNKVKIPVKANEKIEYVKKALQSYENPNTRLDFLNLFIVIRTELNLSTEKLKEFRCQLRMEQKSYQIGKMKKTGEDLMKYENFEKALNDCFDKDEWKKYIVNYLMMNFGVRNKDLNLSVIKFKKEIKEGENFLLFKKDKVLYIRDDYKTQSTYGTKTHEITDSKFVTSVKKVGFGKLITDQQISNGLRKLYINQMAEAKIFKMVIDFLYSNNDSESIKKLADNRGTSLSVVKDFYNVNSTGNPIDKAMSMK